MSSLLRPAADASALAMPRVVPETWDALRLAFHGSPLVDVSLRTLAQHIDGCSWPVDADDEKPSDYIDLCYGEALARLRSHGFAPSKFDILADILRRTLAFDESFGAMAVVASDAEAAADPIRRNLRRLGIPEDFPVDLANLPPGTLHFCDREGLHTLGAFLDFSRSASRSVIVGGEFRDLLNAVTHIDEETLARHLPFRPRASGLYLVEALGHLARPLGIEERVAIARDPVSAPADLRAKAARLVEHFSDQATQLRAAIAEGVPYARLVVSLEHLSLESAVAALLRLYVEPAGKAPAPAPGAGPRRDWRPRWWPGSA